MEARRGSQRPRQLLLVALALLVIEGAVRKWFIGSETGYRSYLTYFSKDLAFAAILLWPAQPLSSPAWSTFCRFLIFGGGLFVAGAILSCLRGLNPVGALLTLRAGLLLPMIALFAARRLPRTRLEDLALLLAALTLLNCVLGFVQSHLPPEHVLNRYVVNDSAVTAVQSLVRATGTFSYITGMGVISCVGVWAGMVLLASGRTRLAQAMGVMSIIAGLGCALASVSRGPILVGCLMLLVWAGMSRAGFVALAASKTMWLPAAILVCGGGFVPRFSELARPTLQRHEESNETLGQRAFGQIEEAWEAAGWTPFGAGLGTEQIAGNYVATGTMGFTNYETQFPRIIAETGVLGLGGFLVISIGAILSLQESKKTASNEGVTAAIFATQLLFVPFLYGNVLFNHIASALVWIILAGALAGWERASTASQKNDLLPMRASKHPDPFGGHGEPSK